mmetsp:Transcript_53746/g.158178  ORF Transcript_53746/g.158178 Transcript_53746/m.158178 type:complete len:200 (-) Transcript_53746:574-1173(-)
MLSFSFAAKFRMLCRKFMSLTSFTEYSSYESWMNKAVILLMNFSSGLVSTTFLFMRIWRPSKVSLMMSTGFLLALISTMSFFVIELQASSASFRKGIALSSSTWASAFSLLIASASAWQSAFCPLTCSAFLSAFPFSPITFSRRAVVFFSSALRTTSCSFSWTFSFSTNTEASWSFCSPTFTLRSCTLISSYFTWYSCL